MRCSRRLLSRGGSHFGKYDSGRRVLEYKRETRDTRPEAKSLIEAVTMASLTDYSSWSSLRSRFPRHAPRVPATGAELPPVRSTILIILPDLFSAGCAGKYRNLEGKEARETFRLLCPSYNATSRSSSPIWAAHIMASSMPTVRLLLCRRSRRFCGKLCGKRG